MFKQEYEILKINRKKIELIFIKSENLQKTMKRQATAVWNGSGKEGKGHLTTQSTTLNKTQYSYSSRFEQGVGTNPEELVAAAHAGCFAMKLSFILGEAGFTPDTLNATAHVNCPISKTLNSKISVEATLEN